MSQLVRLSKSVIGSAEISGVVSVLEKAFLGMGSETQAFEAEIADFIGGDRFVACVNTGTSALHLATQAVGVGPGDEVLIPTITYVASFQAVHATGAKPVACEVLKESGLIDLVDAEKRLTPKTKAIMPVHYASHMGDLQALYNFAEKHHLRVIEDAAHAFGCTYQGRNVGSFGDVVCFSFDGIKNITSGEGGAVVTADEAVIERVKDARLLGVEKDTEARFQGQRSWEFDVTASGWRYHMSDVMAAIGRVQLARFGAEFKEARQSLARRYREALGSIEGVTLLETVEQEVVPHILPVLVPSSVRDGLREALSEENIQSGIHYKPNHLLTLFGGGKESFPVAEKMYEELVTLPLHPEVTAENVDTVCSIIAEQLNRGVK